MLKNATHEGGGRLRWGEPSVPGLDRAEERVHIFNRRRSKVIEKASNTWQVRGEHLMTGDV